MNPHNDRIFPNPSEALNQSGLPSQLGNQGSAVEPELELWEPPFERWLRLADDLLRDWPQGPAPRHRN